MDYNPSMHLDDVDETQAVMQSCANQLTGEDILGLHLVPRPSLQFSYYLDRTVKPRREWSKRPHWKRAALCAGRLDTAEPSR